MNNKKPKHIIVDDDVGAMIIITIITTLKRKGEMNLDEKKSKRNERDINKQSKKWIQEKREEEKNIFYLSFHSHFYLTAIAFICLPHQSPLSPFLPFSFSISE